jgi:hypothetical protein
MRRELLRHAREGKGNIRFSEGAVLGDAWSGSRLGFFVYAMRPQLENFFDGLAQLRQRHCTRPTGFDEGDGLLV